MGSATLTGRLILVAEDDPLIAMDIDATFESAGARVINAATTPAAIAEDGDLAAAGADHGLADGKIERCARLQSLKIPLMACSEYPPSDAYPGARLMPKPATPSMLSSAMGEQLSLYVSSPGDARE